MTINQENISQRLDELIKLAHPGNAGSIEAGEVTSGTISLLDKLYGHNSEKLKAYNQLYQDYVKNKYKDSTGAINSICSNTLGVLKSIKSEVEAGLVGNLEIQAQGGIFGDFINLAKESLDESKDVAAVLVSAALEDALKKFAFQNGLDVDDASMEQVINALKREGLLKGGQASLAKSHKQLRKYAFHANWKKIDKISVNSAIATMSYP
jgi:hypothetical protein